MQIWPCDRAQTEPHPRRRVCALFLTRARAAASFGAATGGLIIAQWWPTTSGCWRSSVCNRGALTPGQVGVAELISLTEITLGSCPREDCALCAQVVPVNTAYAHGADYVRANGDWP
jgi:hypothetical protein